MKKVFSFIIVLFIIISISACGNADENDVSNVGSTGSYINSQNTDVSNEPIVMPETYYSVMLAGVSDSNFGVSHKLEFNAWNFKIFTSSDAPKTASISVGGIEASGTYNCSVQELYESGVSYEYTGENGTFEISEDGVLRCYRAKINRDTTENNRAYSEKECINIACEFLANFVDPSEYTITSKYYDSLNAYSVCFDKYSNGILCDDRAIVSVKTTGQIVSYFSTMLGKMKPNMEFAFDLAVVEKDVMARMAAEYKTASNDFDEITYEILGYGLTVDENGEQILRCNVSVRRIDHLEDVSLTYSEAITLAIQNK